MLDFIPEILIDLNVVSVTVRIFLSVIIGGLIGIDRGRHGRAAGIRTHILVCLGSAMTIMVGIFCVESLGGVSDPLRLGAQVVSGIGFLGAGTIILRGKFHVTGLTTAAGLWATAAIGLAIGIGFYEGAIICTVAVIATVSILSHLESVITKKNRKATVYAEIKNTEKVNETVAVLKERFGAYDIRIMSPHSSTAGYVGIEATVSMNKNQNQKDTIKAISELPDISFAVEAG